MSNHSPIGFQFFINSYTNHFAQIFESISIEDYTWYVTSYSENYVSCPDGTVQHFLPVGVYSGKEIIEMITEKPKYYILQLCMYGVPNKAAFDPSTINYYQDYLNSTAEFAFLCGDGFVDFYIKDEHKLQTIFDSCKHYYCDNSWNGKIYPAYITLENDGREGFYV